MLGLVGGGQVKIQSRTDPAVSALDERTTGGTGAGLAGSTQQARFLWP